MSAAFVEVMCASRRGCQFVARQEAGHGIPYLNCLEPGVCYIWRLLVCCLEFLPN